MNIFEQIKTQINKMRENADFSLIEDFPEDFVESRTDWDTLADNYRSMYYALKTIEDLCKSIKYPVEKSEETEVSRILSILAKGEYPKTINFDIMNALGTLGLIKRDPRTSLTDFGKKIELVLRK